MIKESACSRANSNFNRFEPHRKRKTQMGISEFSFRNCKDWSSICSKGHAIKDFIHQRDGKFEGGTNPATDQNHDALKVDTVQDGVHVRSRLIEKEAAYLGDEWQAMPYQKSRLYYSTVTIAEQAGQDAVATIFDSSRSQKTVTELSKNSQGKISGFSRSVEGATPASSEKVTTKKLSKSQAQTLWIECEGNLGQSPQVWHDEDRAVVLTEDYPGQFSGSQQGVPFQNRSDFVEHHGFLNPNG